MTIKDSLTRFAAKTGIVSLATTFAGAAAAIGTVEGVSYMVTGQPAMTEGEATVFFNPLVLGALAAAGLTGYLMGRWDGRAAAHKPAPLADAAPKPEAPPALAVKSPGGAKPQF